MSQVLRLNKDNGKTGRFAFYETQNKRTEFFFIVSFDDPQQMQTFITERHSQHGCFVAFFVDDSSSVDVWPVWKMEVHGSITWEDVSCKIEHIVLSNKQRSGHELIPILKVEKCA